MFFVRLVGEIKLIGLTELKPQSKNNTHNFRRKISIAHTHTIHKKNIHI